MYDTLDLLPVFQMRRFLFGDGSVARKLMHFCLPCTVKILAGCGQHCHCENGIIGDIRSE